MNTTFHQFCLFVFDIYAKIIYYFNCIIFNYFLTEKYIFFKIVNVYCKSHKLQITDKFISNKNFKILNNEVYCFEWIFDNIKYIQYLHDTTLQYLVPYTIHNLRNDQVYNKIIACLTTDNITKNIQNITLFLKQIAGPKQDFYKGIYQIHTKDVFGLVNKHLQITTTKQYICFDLTKDNILEL